MKKKPIIQFLPSLILLLSVFQAQSQTIIPYASGVEDDEGNFRITSHVEKHDSLYFIAGVFDSVNSLPIKTIAIWDGQSFRDGTIGLDGTFLHQRRVNKLFTFDESLYLRMQNSSILFKWSGTQWEFFMERLGGSTIFDDRLYFYGNNMQVDTLPTSDIVYYQDGHWHSVHVEYNHPLGGEYLGINGLAKWQDKLVVSTNAPGLFGISYIDSVGGLIPLDPSYLKGNLFTIQDKLFLLEGNQDEIYEYRNNKFEYLQDIDKNFHSFFELEDELYLGSVYDGTYIYNDSSFVLRGTDYLSIMDYAELDDDEYIITGKLFSGTDYKVRLNDLAMMKYEKPAVSLEVNRDTICEDEYVYFTAKENDVFMEYFWVFEGAVTTQSNDREPKVKYSNEGEFLATLVCKNIVGYSDTLSKLIVVETGCNLEGDDRYDNTWLLGYHYGYAKTVAGIDFSNEDPQSTMFNSPSYFTGQSLSMSDKNGDLLFYSNGNSLYDYNNNEVNNSIDFNSDENILGWGYDTYAGPQQMISIPSSAHDSIYYIFHLPQDLVGDNNSVIPTKLLMSQINVDKERNLELKIENLPIVQDTLQNYTMQAHRHANGEDWWILAFEMYSPNYYKILLKSDGSTIVESEELNIQLERHLFQTVFSPNGNKFALIDGQDKMSYVWDFNTQTGLLSNRIDILGDLEEDTDFPCGVAFSPNSRFLYISSYHFMKQYDLCNEVIEESEIVVGVWDGMYDWIYPFSFGRMRLGPDNKIYVAGYSSSIYLSTINNTNEKGIDCDFRQHDFELEADNKNWNNCIPDYPHYRNTTDSLFCNALSENVVPETISNSIKLYPNPTYNTLDVMSSAEILGSDIKIYNDHGQVLIESKYTGSSFDVSKLNTGLHYLSITTSKKIINISFMKI
ncbi:MAG: hypothetical protein ACJATI_005633 [Halioglobus sp.]|jgi:hypothetical protein